MEPEFLSWEETAHIKFEGKGNNDTKRQATFMLDWLGQDGSRILGLHSWLLEDKQNKKKIKDALKAKCQPHKNAHLYKQQFFLIRQDSQDTFQIYTKNYATYMTSASLRKKADAMITKTVQPVGSQPEISG